MNRPRYSETRWPLVTVDIDGTLTTIHGWKAIADTLGRTAAYERTQRRFMAHEIGEDEHLEDMLKIAAGRSLKEVEEAMAGTPRIDRITEGVQLLHDRGSRVALLTHNPPYVCEWYCVRFGFDEFEGAGAQAITGGIIQAPEYVRADKASGLRRLTERNNISASQVVHVGDGWADAAVFPLVGAGVALNSSLPDVEAAADLVLRTRDFREVAVAIEALPPRR
ncbi:MAG: haloacid dehalogenase-like hydrolase [Thermoplasmata archaeon]